MWRWGEVLAELVPGRGAVSWVPRSATFQSQEAKRPAKPWAGSGRSPGRGWEQRVARGTDTALRPFFRSPGLCSSPANSHASRTLSPQHLRADTDEYQPGPLVPCAPPGEPLLKAAQAPRTVTCSGPHSQQLRPSRPSTVQLGRVLEVRPRIPKNLPSFSIRVGAPVCPQGPDSQ